MNTDELRRIGRNVLLGDAHQTAGDVAGALNSAAVMIDYQRVVIAYLCAGMQAYLTGSYEGPYNRRPGTCRHGIRWHSACEECIDAHFYAVLEGIEGYKNPAGDGGGP